MLNNCFYYINQYKVTSSNLVTPTKSPNFQIPCFLPVFKAQKGIETYQNKYLPITLQYLYNVFTTNLPQIIGDLLVTKKTHGHQFSTDTPFANKFEEYSIC